MRRLLLLMAVLALPLRAETIAITHVDVVSMKDARIDRDQTVLVRGDRIERIGAADSVAVPADARALDGAGRWLLPGLIDMHVHVRAEDLRAYVARGVTTVRDMGSIESVLEAKRRVDRGEVMGPTIVTTSPYLNGPGPKNPSFSIVVTDTASVPDVVDRQVSRGVRAMKLYENLSPAVYDALISEAHARGLKAVGHVSALVDVRHAIDRQDSIEHLSGYERAVSRTVRGDVGSWIDVDESKFEELAQRTAASGVWNTPTLYAYDVIGAGLFGPLDHERIIANRQAFMAVLHAHGARFLAGTDAGYIVPAGSSLLEELRALVAAGLTPYEALVAATRDAAAFLGEDCGTIEVGKRADLLLLDGNPLESVDALRSPLVIVRGTIFMEPRTRRVAH